MGYLIPGRVRWGPGTHWMVVIVVVVVAPPGEGGEQFVILMEKTKSDGRGPGAQNIIKCRKICGITQSLLSPLEGVRYINSVHVMPTLI